MDIQEANRVSGEQAEQTPVTQATASMGASTILAAILPKVEESSNSIVIHNPMASAAASQDQLDASPIHIPLSESVGTQNDSLG